MVLAIDIGNTNIVFGLHDKGQWTEVWRVETIPDNNAQIFYENYLRNEFLESRLKMDLISQIGFSSVVPILNPIFRNLCEMLFPKVNLCAIQPDMYDLLGIKVARPYEIGTDLIANAYAAIHTHHCNSIVVDFGTALTFTVVNKEGEILGVNISPGINTAIHSLSSGTAQLPSVPLVYPSSAIGKNTNHAIQAGVLIGYVGLVKHQLKEIRKEAGPDFNAIATGGLSSIITPLESSFYAIEPHLTLDGIRLISEKNK